VNKKILSISVLGIFCVAFSYFAFTKQSKESSIPEFVDFNYHVRPILSDRCFKCHGPDAKARKAGLRLDTEEGAFAALKDDPTHHVLVPGDPLQSAMYARMITTDTAEVMPPPSSNLSLTKNEIEVIRKWIAQGAKYKKHWSFIPPVKPVVPEVDDDMHAVNAIDNFVFVKQASYGLEPNEQAEKETLLKRVSMDLTGLPPTIEQQDRFMKDN